MIGTTVSHYEIVEQLGSGGMGVVYTARDTKLDRLVALKFLPAELSRDADANARFMQEAKAASALDHPNICTIYEVGKAEDGRLFISMAYYEGQTLKYRLDEETIDESEAIDIARQIAEGLRAAHRKGIVHRDIKPANIMVTDDGLVKILDFGLAKLPGVLSLTQVGSTMGTAAYMSPEQIQGDEVDGQTDLWSLGVVLYQMITGKRPFEGDYEQALTYSILNKEVVPPAGVDPEIGNLFAGLLAKDREKRLASADELLEQLPGRRESAAMPASPRPDNSLISNRLAIGAGVILLIAVFASSYFNFWKSETPEAGSDEMTIGVMPFTIRGQPDLDYLGEGIVDLLSVRLDGAGDLRAVDPNAILGLIQKDGLEILAPEDAVALSTRLGAGKTIIGSVTQLGSELQISASLYGSDGSSLTEATTKASNETDLSRALDILATSLISGLFAGQTQNDISVAAVTTSSFPALKAYLAGRQLSRTGHWEEASAKFEEAVAEDSTFALAWGALGYAYGWIPDPRESEAQRQALLHSENLPWRAKTLIQAANFGFRTGDGERAMNLYRSILADYPHDTEALRGMGEAMFHYNPRFGAPHSDADTYFERALELSPNNVDFLVHLFDGAMDDWNFDRADSIGTLIDSLVQRQDVHEYFEHARGVWNRSRGDSSWSISDQGTMNTHFTNTVFRNAATRMEDLEAAEQVARMMAEPGRYPENDRNRMLFNAALLRTAQGRFSDFSAEVRQAGSNYTGRTIISRTLLYGIPVYPASDAKIQSLRADLAAWDTSAAPLSLNAPADIHRGEYAVIKAYLGSLLALRAGDTDSFVAGKQFLADRADSTSGNNLAYSSLRSIDAMEALQNGDFSAAVAAVDDARLVQIWRDGGKSPLTEQVADRFIKAEALRASGQFEEAIRVYRSLTAGETSWGYLVMGPEYLGVADSYEQLGEIEKAIEFYTRFVRLWKNCDPELVPIREEAQSNLDRLLRQTVSEPG